MFLTILQSILVSACGHFVAILVLFLCVTFGLTSSPDLPTWTVFGLYHTVYVYVALTGWYLFGHLRDKGPARTVVFILGVVALHFAVFYVSKLVADAGLIPDSFPYQVKNLLFTAGGWLLSTAQSGIRIITP